MKASPLVAAFNLETAAVDRVPPDFDADRFLDDSCELALAPSLRCWTEPLNELKFENSKPPIELIEPPVRSSTLICRLLWEFFWSIPIP